jgi:hypothetical protein
VGTLFTIGALGVDVSGLVGFDIAVTGAGFAVAAAAGTSGSQLYVVNLTTGALVPIGAVGSSDAIAATAIAP